MEEQGGDLKLPQPDSSQKTEAGRREPVLPSNLPAQEKPTGDENTMGQEDWQSLLSLGKKPYLELTRNPEDLKALQDLTSKGEGIFGKEEFVKQLGQKQAEEKAREEAGQIALRKAREESADDMVAKIQSIADASKSAMQGLLAEFDAKQVERQADLDQTLNALRQPLRQDETSSRANEALKGLGNDPQVIRARADLDWISLLSGKSVEGLSPQLQERITQFRNNAKTNVLRDPSGYQQQEQALRNEFFKARGVNVDKP